MIAQYAALLRSTVVGDQEVVIEEATSLWKIAERNYGSGYYFPTLLPPNDIAFSEADSLRAGQKIIVPAMYKIWVGDERVVRLNDSPWAIAEEELGEGQSYLRLAERNRRFIESPDRIYPVQLLRINED